MDDNSLKAIQRTTSSEITYTKFISPNDAGATTGHQAGFYIHKQGASILFDTAGERGQQLERWVTIKWQDDFETNTRFIYYGRETRNEYRITNLGLDQDLLNTQSVGNLFILCRVNIDYYYGYILSSDDEIENYLSYFNLSPNEANGHISSEKVGLDENSVIAKYANSLSGESFPSTKDVASAARDIFYELGGSDADSDKTITTWTDIEYRLFKLIEDSQYKLYLNDSFESVESLTKVANEILNRRKSRAGKSLEHHLAKIFDINQLHYSSQKTTEGRKKPDFLMPSIEAYRDTSFDFNKLTFLGAKTTCKDRWRQIINEAERIPNKHLFTLQPGISSNQLDEMKDENITLVVPKENIITFPPQNREDIMTLDQFIVRTKALQP